MNRSSKTVFVKKIVSIISVSSVLLASAFIGASGTADDIKNTDENTVIADNSNSEALGYESYISSAEGYSNSKDRITLLGKDAVNLKGGEISDGELVLGESEFSADWLFNVAESALYEFEITYCAKIGSDSEIIMGLLLDGKLPFAEAENFFLNRLWENSGEVQKDGYGNEFSPDQKQAEKTQTGNLRDANGFITETLLLALDKGEHTLTLFGEDAFCDILKITLKQPKEIPSYAEVIEKYSSVPKYDGKEIIIEGEDAVLKSNKSLISMADNSSVKVKPNNPYISKLNYIGGSNWNQNGDTITWTVKVEETGLYKLGFSYRQKYLLNGTSYRSLKINGEVPFKEADKIGFGYNNGWKFMTLENDDEPLLIYLEAGKETTISLTVTLGDASSFSGRLRQLTDDLGKIYREIVMITGETPDANRDYNLFRNIPDLEKRLKDALEQIEWLEEESSRINESKSDSNTAILKKMRVTINAMLKRKYEAQNKKGSFYDSYAALSSWLYEMQSMALDIDAIVLATPDKDFERAQNNFFAQIAYSAKRFISSFIYDYDTVSKENSESREHLTLWVSWSREQAMVLNNLISGDFTPKTGIDVTVRVTNASLLQAILSGNGPDCSLSVSRTLPVNLAMRGGLYNLSDFEDYDEVMQQFMPGSDEPYYYKGKSYALPSTQQFYMMFYRTDVFEEMELEVPKTWDEFLDVSSILMQNNMQVALPYTEITDMGQVDAGVGALSIFPTFLLQNGLSLYNEEKTATTLTTSVDVMKVFEFWTEFYTDYDFPKSYNFFNHFRTGLMPLAIQNYTTFASLSVAAPEISGKWEMVPIPGTMQADGTINNKQTGQGSGAIILKLSKSPESAWELLKWWCSTEIQSRYATNLESVVGVSSRYTTANVEALKSLSWGTSTWKSLEAQWKQVEEMPELPGGYYVARAVDQAYWNIVELGSSSKDMLLKWGRIADDEIDRKIRQYETVK